MQVRKQLLAFATQVRGLEMCFSCCEMQWPIIGALILLLLLLSTIMHTIHTLLVLVRINKNKY
jgi:hypothetical protein